jgi:DNA invertase Pin-like site-specific DNA recombinase
MTTNRAALYARVSTSGNKHGKKQDPEMQLRELREYCDRRKWTSEIFTDPGHSGAKTSRPELDRMMAACRRGKFDVVVVYRFDRFARSVKHLVDALTEFNELGIQFVSLHENVDTTLPQGKLLFHIFAAVAEFERELTRERVISGLELARMPISLGGKGKTLGRPRVVVGEAEISAMRASGASWRTISKKLGIGLGTVHRSAQPRSKNPSGDFSKGSQRDA